MALFNPFQNSNLLNMARTISPFSSAGSTVMNGVSQASKGGLLTKIGGSKITLSGILNGAQKTIGTVNQIVPIYNQIKPMVQNSKVLLNITKSLKSDGNNEKGFLASLKRRKHPVNHNFIYDVSPTDNNLKEDKNEEIKENANSPSKPFFL